MANVDNFIYLGEKKFKNAAQSPSKITVECQYRGTRVTQQEVKPANSSTERVMKNACPYTHDS